MKNSWNLEIGVFFIVDFQNSGYILCENNGYGY